MNKVKKICLTLCLMAVSQAMCLVSSSFADHRTESYFNNFIINLEKGEAKFDFTDNGLKKDHFRKNSLALNALNGAIVEFTKSIEKGHLRPSPSKLVEVWRRTSIISDKFNELSYRIDFSKNQRARVDTLKVQSNLLLESTRNFTNAYFQVELGEGFKPGFESFDDNLTALFKKRAESHLRLSFEYFEIAYYDGIQKNLKLLSSDFHELRALSFYREYFGLKSPENDYFDQGYAANTLVIFDEYRESFLSTVFGSHSHKQSISKNSWYYKESARVHGLYTLYFSQLRDLIEGAVSHQKCRTTMSSPGST